MFSVSLHAHDKVFLNLADAEHKEENVYKRKCI